MLKEFAKHQSSKHTSACRTCIGAASPIWILYSFSCRGVLELANSQLSPGVGSGFNGRRWSRCAELAVAVAVGAAEPC
jgi:hypothetical protein